MFRSATFTWLSLIAALFLQSCLSDIRTPLLKKSTYDTLANEAQAQALLEATRTAHGAEAFTSHQTYEAVGKDHWKGLLGKTGNPWPVNNERIRLRYVVNTFDGQVEFLEGKLEGKKVGLQSWKYYESEPGESAVFAPKMDKNIGFVIPAYQYFFELLNRLQQAPTLRYAGQEKIGEIDYEVLMVSWNDLSPHPEFDQYLLYIDPATNRLRYSTYTLRDGNLPGSKATYGYIEFSDYRDMEGVLIPFSQRIGLFNAKDTDKYVHHMRLESFTFDSFDAKEIQPDVLLREASGDMKPAS